jgi:hypothetical protein
MRNRIYSLNILGNREFQCSENFEGQKQGKILLHKKIRL